MSRGARWTPEQYKQLVEKQQAGKPRGKFNNEWVEIDGIWFQSIKEGEYYKGLKILKKAEVITDFRMQVIYKFIINGFLVCKYKADFVVDYADGHTEVVDVKGIKTAMFRIKEKLMYAVHGIVIKIT